MSKSPQDTLFRLVKSMTKNEKRFFKLFSSIHTIGDQNSYVKLFDAIEKQKNYNETELKKLFIKDKSSGRFDNIKGRLYSSILKSLSTYHSESTPIAKIQKRMHYSDILFDKGLYDESLRLLNKLEDEANETGHLNLLMDIAYKKYKLITQQTEFYSQKDIDDFFSKSIEWNKLIGNQIQYQKIAQSFYALYRSIGLARNEEAIKKYAVVMEDTLLSSPSMALSDDAKYYYYYIHSLYADIIGNYELGLEMKSKCLQHTKYNSAYLHIYPVRHIGALYNFITSALSLKKYDAAAEKIKDLKSVANRLKELPAQLPNYYIAYSLWALQELNLCLTVKDFELSEKVIEDIEENIEELEQNITEERRVVLFYTITVSCMENNNFHKALKFVNKLLQTSPSIRPEFQAVGRILNLFIHLELSNDELLGYITRSTYRFLLKRERLFQIETLILQFIKKSVNVSRYDMGELLKELKEKLLLLMNDPYEKRAFELFDFISWTEAKLSRRSLNETLKEKVQKKST